MRPVINLGFSGNGRMESEVAELLSELDPEVYILDCLPNMTAQMVEERAVMFVRRLRASHSSTPIVLVEDRTYADAFFRATLAERNAESRAAFRAAYGRLRSENYDKLYYVPGEGLLGNDGEATTDGSHPNDLGMMRYADALEPVLREALQDRL